MVAKDTLRRAIAAKCKGCIYDETEPGTWRQQVEACEILACPLWGVRPKSFARSRFGPPSDESSGDRRLAG